MSQAVLESWIHWSVRRFARIQSVVGYRICEQASREYYMYPTSVESVDVNLKNIS